MAEGSSPDDNDDDKAIPWIALSKSSDQKLKLYTSERYYLFLSFENLSA